MNAQIWVHYSTQSLWLTFNHSDKSSKVFSNNKIEEGVTQFTRDTVSVFSHSV